MGDPELPKIEKIGRWSLIFVRIMPEVIGLQWSVVKMLSIRVAVVGVILVGREIVGWRPILLASVIKSVVVE